MRVLIVVVNFNGIDLTLACLQSLKVELEAMPNARVGLCDNGSTADEYDLLKATIAGMPMADRIDLTRLQPNRGFTGGNNAVIRSALESETPPDLVMLLNNDTVIRPGAIRALVRYMTERPEVGVAASRLEYPDGESQCAARRFPSIFSEFESYAKVGPISRLLKRWVMSLPEQDEPHPCGWAPGAALMIRREVLETIGLLDEDLYTYFDDVDFCYRANRAGWPTWYVPESRIVHLVGQTTGITASTPKPRRRASYWFLARRHYWLKNRGPLVAALADLAAISGLLAWWAWRGILRKPNPDPPLLVWDMIRHSVLVTGFTQRPVPNPALVSGSDGTGPASI